MIKQSQRNTPASPAHAHSSKQMFMNIWSLLLEMKHVCDVEADLCANFCHSNINTRLRFKNGWKLKMVSSFRENIKEWSHDYLKKSKAWRAKAGGRKVWLSVGLAAWNVSNSQSWDQEHRRGMKGWREECSLTDNKRQEVTLASTGCGKCCHDVITGLPCQARV